MTINTSRDGSSKARRQAKPFVLDTFPGDHIEKVCEGALATAKANKRNVRFEFNGKTILITPSDTKRSALVKWDKDHYKNRQKTCLYPKTAKEALQRWDDGQGVFTVEMGGLGPGYEQAIQILVFEIIRDQLGKPLPAPGTASNGWRDDTVSRCDESCLGFSGAQVGAAKNLAYHYLHDGYEKTLMKFKEKDGDRLTQVSKELPKAPPVSSQDKH
jgi:hypothetical protein